ncbi:MAG: hypothetical protein ACTSYM_07115 [Candidatus Baldrarchaeia archaeon]
MFNNELNKLEELLEATPTYEIEKTTLPPAPLKTEERKTSPIPPISSVTPPPAAPSSAPPSVKPTAKFETVNIPVLVNKNILKKVKDKIARSILELCDGSHTTSEIAKKLNIPRSKVLITLGNFSKEIKYISGVRKVEE